MYQAYEATIDQAGIVHLPKGVEFTGVRRVLIVILDDNAAHELDEAALLSEESLAESWNRPEEDAAWAYLQPER